MCVRVDVRACSCFRRKQGTCLLTARVYTPHLHGGLHTQPVAERGGTGLTSLGPVHPTHTHTVALPFTCLPMPKRVHTQARFLSEQCRENHVVQRAFSIKEASPCLHPRRTNAADACPSLLSPCVPFSLFCVCLCVYSYAGLETHSALPFSLVTQIVCRYMTRPLAPLLLSLRRP